MYRPKSEFGGPVGRSERQRGDRSLGGSARHPRSQARGSPALWISVVPGPGPRRSPFHAGVGPRPKRRFSEASFAEALVQRRESAVHARGAPRADGHRPAKRAREHGPAQLGDQRDSARGPTTACQCGKRAESCLHTPGNRPGAGSRRQLGTLSKPTHTARSSTTACQQNSLHGLIAILILRRPREAAFRRRTAEEPRRSSHSDTAGEG